MNKPPLPNGFPIRQFGFSLAELAIVLVIISLLSSGLLVGLSSQRSQTRNTDAQRQEEMILEAMIGFAMSSGRLPCPADRTITTANGAGNEEQLCIPADCSTPPPPDAPDKVCKLEHGVIPWKTLGLQETDPWGNRFTYFVGKEFSNPITKKEKLDGVRTRFTLDTPGRANIQDGTGQAVVSDIPAVIVSHGSRGVGAYQSTGLQIAGASSDELENSKDTQLFITHTPTENFDDIVTWINPSILKSRMVAVGKLP